MQVHPQSRLDTLSRSNLRFTGRAPRFVTQIRLGERGISGVETLFTFRLAPATPIGSTGKYTRAPALIKRHPHSPRLITTSHHYLLVKERTLDHVYTARLRLQRAACISNTPAFIILLWTCKTAYLPAGRSKNVKSALTVDMAVVGVPSARHACRHRPYSSHYRIQIRAHWPLSALNCAPRR